MAAAPRVEVEVRPRWPYRLPRAGRDGVMRRPTAGALLRLLHVDGEPIAVGVRQPAPDRVVFRATAGDEAPVARDLLEVAIERMRFALGVDEDLSDFYATFSRDPRVGPAVRARPWHRPRRRPWPWEALAWAVTEQLIESSRAAEIQRRIVGRWGPRRRIGAEELRDVPGAAVIAGRAPAELASIDLAPSRAAALIRCAREVSLGRADPARAGDDRRLLRLAGIGPWTVQCLGFHGRGDPDALPAGDLAYVKLVGRLAGLGRRATVPEIEEYFAPYAPYRGLAGSFMLTRWHGRIAAGPPLRMAA
ncbi:MAG TPA: hypothetical protein VK919_13200 [Solirubrobacterales bacterium]|nr:hypothetical protein [Solirubrobacterales bacterium]